MYCISKNALRSHAAWIRDARVGRRKEKQKDTSFTPQNISATMFPRLRAQTKNVSEKVQKHCFVSREKIFPQQMLRVSAKGETFRSTMFPCLQGALV